MNWDDITIGKYIQITQIKETDKDANIKAAAIAKGITYQQARNIKIVDLVKILEDFYNLDFDELPSKPKQKWRDYKIHLLIRDITAGQMTDYDDLLQACCVTEMQDGEEVKVVSDDLITDNIHKFMGILTSKKGDTNETFEERAELFYNEMPIKIAFGAHVFFCKVAEKRDEILRTSLKEEVENRTS